MFWLAIVFLLIPSVVYAKDVAESAENKSQIVSSFRAAPMASLNGQNCHDANLDDSQWQAFEFPFVQPQQHLCIRGTMQITDTNLPSNPALLFLALSAYHIYVDEILIGSNGIPGNTAEAETVGAISSLIPLNKTSLSRGEHLVSVELSSFNVASSFTAVAYTLIVMDHQTFYDTIIYASIFAATLIGGLVVMSLIFFTLFLRYSRQPSYWVFALLCLTTAMLLVAEQWKLWVNYAYDIHLLRMQIVIALTLVVTTLLPSFYLTQYAFINKKRWLALIVISLLVAVYNAESYDARSEWLFIVALVFVLVINVLALSRKQSGAVAALAITALSLTCIFIAPRLFLELGFSVSIAFVLASIGISLLAQLIKQRKLALETGKIKGELLRRNLQPHYLMNCLMQVQELIDFAPKQASEFVQQLAEEFRSLVKMSDKDVVSLEEELKLCRSHLKIMSVRYQQQYELEVNYTANSEQTHACDIHVPSAIIHSQIENCFTHNRITSSQPLTLTISASQKRVTLILSTPIDEATEHKGVGIGEAYIRAKIAQVCQPDWLVHSTAKGNQWVTTYDYQLLDNK